MVTSKQMVNLVSITDALKQKDMSIVELQKKMGMKRSTLIYYLGILEKWKYIDKEVREKEQGKPTILKFNKKMYEEMFQEFKKKIDEEKNQMLNHPLTFEIINLLKKDSTLSRKDLIQNTKEYFGKAIHLNWLIQEGYILQEYKLTEKGEKFLKEHGK